MLLNITLNWMYIMKICFRTYLTCPLWSWSIWTYCIFWLTYLLTHFLIYLIIIRILFLEF